MHPQVKFIGPNGQVSLGKAFAGKMILLNQIDAGTWIIKTGQFIPDTEQWIHEPDHLQKLDDALNWAEKNEPVNNFKELTKGMVDETKTNRN